MRAAGVIEQDGAILLIHRRKSGRDYYVLPGGTVEAGETPAEACVREVEEETSLVVRALRPIWVQPELGQEVHYFRVEAFQGTATLSGPEARRCRAGDHYELTWVKRTDLGSLAVFPTNLCADVLSDR